METGAGSIKFDMILCMAKDQIFIEIVYLKLKSFQSVYSIYSHYRNK